MTQVKAIRKDILIRLAQLSVLTAVVTLAPLVKQQSITGPIVNAVLFASVVLLGIRKSWIVAVIPSLIALIVGLLPAVMAPMIPFIILGNLFLMIAFDFLKRNYFLAVMVSSLLKFIFLYATSSMVIRLFMEGPVASKIAAAMSWPQLFTALAGGLIAYVFLKGRFKK
jgi:hypothetical protein